MTNDERRRRNQLELMNYMYCMAGERFLLVPSAY